MKREDYNIEHHAVICGLFGQWLEERYGSYGLNILANGIMCYAHRRGSRMRQRAIQDGRALDYETFLSYGELKINSRPEDYSVKQDEPVYINCCHRCMWQEAWVKYHLERYGEVYCAYVDLNLVQGFNPDLAMIVETSLGRGDACCTFVNVGYARTLESRQKIDQIKETLAGKYQKDFLYHCADLFESMKRTVAQVTDDCEAEEIAQKVLTDFSGLFGTEAETELLEECNLDFTMG